MADNLAKTDVAKREEEILTFWRENRIFEKSIEKQAPKGKFVFYEGPPTANGRPGIHHLESRAFKDAIPRYKTMQGYRVERRAGWDTHGLPVELEVEKQLGFSGKPDIEKYGIAAFNRKCRESVLQYIDEWLRFTERIGFWVDQKRAFYTFDPEYIEAVWGILKKADRDKRLYKDYQVVPWCPRCGTALSSHEVAQGYEDVTDLSLTVKFKIKNPEKHGFPENTFLLAWTTTPWTLPGNVALAVGKNIEYEVREENGEHMIRSGKEFKGEKLVGIEYEPLYPFAKEFASEEEKKKFDNAFKVYAAPFVTTEEGTGIVHTAVMYGTDDFELGREENLPRVHLVEPSGRFKANMGFLAGRAVHDEDVTVDIVKNLAHRGLLFSKETYTHSYPFCWRCKTALIYYARDSWYVRMTELKERLIAENRKIHWEPAHIKEGRMGEWLQGVKDWAISRERYWATPLPVWESVDKSEWVVIGSVEELGKRLKLGMELPKNEKGELDLHRPYIDEVVLMSDSGKEMRRVPDVIDVWFDSGAMPFATCSPYPADYIAEAIDQTRGWFYTLLAVGILMGRGTPYRNVICLGHLLDKKGQKMSKSKGNAVDPWQTIAQWGADTLRFWMYSVSGAGESKNFDERTLREAGRVLSWFENSAKFYELFKGSAKAAGREEPIDRWMNIRVDEAVRNVTAGLESYDLTFASRAVASLLEDLSQWYVRRIRNRAREGDCAALETLRKALHTSARLLAPFAPFLAESVFRSIRAEGDPESVHLSAWPTSKKKLFSFGGSKKLLADMKEVRRACSLALEARAKANIKVRQPLRELKIKNRTLERKRELLALIRDEVNVKAVVVDTALTEEIKLDTIITDELRDEGEFRELARAVQDLRKHAGLQPKDGALLIVPERETALVSKHWEKLKIVANLIGKETGAAFNVRKA